MKRWGLALGLAVMACSGPSRSDASFAVADSAGAELISTPVAVWDSMDAWTLGSEPVLSIGLSDGDAAYLFQDVRSVLRLRDGQLVVADGLSREIRFFSGDGAHLRSIGREGRGPGEFVALSWVELCSGRLYAFDTSLRRVSVWSLEGALVETFPLLEPNVDRRPYRGLCGPGGQFVLAGWGDQPRRARGSTFALYLQPAPVWLFEPATSAYTRLGTYNASERVFAVNPLTGGSGSGPHPFGRAVAFALDSSRVFIGTSERLQVEVRAHDGRLQRILRGPDVDLSITSDMIARYRRAEMIRPDSLRRGQLEANDMAMPPSRPAYTRLLLDPLDNLWVERFTAFSGLADRWGVFGHDGRFFGHLEMPSNFRVMSVGADEVLGVSADEFGVERIAAYRLTR